MLIIQPCNWQPGKVISKKPRFDHAVKEKKRKERNKETEALNETKDQIDLIDIYKTFHPKTADYTFFSSVHGTFSRIDHTLGQKSSLSKFKKIEIIWSIFSEHNTMRLEMNYRGKTREKHKHMETKQYVTK